MANRTIETRHVCDYRCPPAARRGDRERLVEALEELRILKLAVNELVERICDLETDIYGGHG